MFWEGGRESVHTKHQRMPQTQRTCSTLRENCTACPYNACGCTVNVKPSCRVQAPSLGTPYSMYIICTFNDLQFTVVVVGGGGLTRERQLETEPIATTASGGLGEKGGREGTERTTSCLWDAVSCRCCALEVRANGRNRIDCLALSRALITIQGLYPKVAASLIACVNATMSKVQARSSGMDSWKGRAGSRLQYDDACAPECFSMGGRGRLGSTHTGSTLRKDTHGVRCAVGVSERERARVGRRAETCTRAVLVPTLHAADWLCRPRIPRVPNTGSVVATRDKHEAGTESVHLCIWNMTLNVTASNRGTAPGPGATHDCPSLRLYPAAHVLTDGCGDVGTFFSLHKVSRLRISCKNRQRRHSTRSRPKLSMKVCDFKLGVAIHWRLLTDVYARHALCCSRTHLYGFVRGHLFVLRSQPASQPASQPSPELFGDKDGGGRRGKAKRHRRSDAACNASHWARRRAR